MLGRWREKIVFDQASAMRKKSNSKNCAAFGRLQIVHRGRGTFVRWVSTTVKPERMNPLVRNKKPYYGRAGAKGVPPTVLS